MSDRGCEASRVLLVDTAGPVVGVAGWVDGRLVHVEAERIVQGADGWLGPALSRTLGAVGAVEVVGVTIGPGAFTGIRVGVATALGLAVARGVPVAALSSLALRAAWAAQDPAVQRAGWVLALLDARRDRVYAGRFAVSGGEISAVGPELDVPPEEAFGGGSGFAVGEGALRYQPLAVAAGWSLVDRAGDSPVSAGLELLAAAPRTPPGQVACTYLRGVDAVPPRR